jgi:DNA-binding NarL/FixJ family response regulator
MVAFVGGSGSARVATVAPALTGSPGGEPVPSVLWVPDDDVRLLLRGILTLQRHPVVLELTSADALRRWEPPQVALLIVDAVSGADRWREELAEATRARPELRAIVLLPRDREGLRAEAEALGARATLVRPFAVRDLVAAIREALRGSSLLSEG